MLVSGRLGLLASALLCERVLAQRQCYYPSGLTADVAGVFVACNTNMSVASMCCNAQNGDRCTPEGICLSGSAYYRDMCTDQTWLAPECIQLCPTIDNPQVTRCDDDTWCCGGNNSTCCNSGKGVSISATRPGTVALSATLLSSSTSTSTPATTTGSSTTGTGTAASTSAAPASNATSGKSNNNIAIAVGVGVSVGAVLVALAVALFFWRRSVNKKKKPVEIGDANNVERRDQKAPMISKSSDNSPTVRYDGSGIEDGSVMSRLATGSTANQGQKQNAVHPFGREIYEMDQSERKRFHELSGEDRKLGSPHSIEKF